MPSGEIQPYRVSWPKAGAVLWGEDHGAAKIVAVLAGLLKMQSFHLRQHCSAGQRHMNFDSKEVISVYHKVSSGNNT